MRMAINHSSPLWAKIALIGLLTFTFLWFIPSAGKLLLSDIYSLGAKHTISIYGNKNSFNLDRWIEARAQLDKALNVMPHDPSLLFNMGQLNAIRAFKARGNKNISKAYNEEAIYFYEKSLIIRPRDTLTWVNLALTLNMIEAQTNRYTFALQQAKTLSQNDKDLSGIVNRIESRFK